MDSFDFCCSSCLFEEIDQFRIRRDECAGITNWSHYEFFKDSSGAAERLLSLFRLTIRHECAAQLAQGLCEEHLISPPDVRLARKRLEHPDCLLIKFDRCDLIAFLGFQVAQLRRRYCEVLAVGQFRWNFSHELVKLLTGLRES